MMWRLLTWGIIAATLLFPVASGFGAERVVTRRDNFGEDLRFVDQYLGLTWPEYYRTQAPPSLPTSLRHRPPLELL